MIYRDELHQFSDGYCQYFREAMQFNGNAIQWQCNSKVVQRGKYPGIGDILYEQEILTIKLVLKLQPGSIFAYVSLYLDQF